MVVVMVVVMVMVMVTVVGWLHGDDGVLYRRYCSCVVGDSHAKRFALYNN